MARHLMDMHGLQGWDLRFDRARRRAGQTNFTDRFISLSAPLLALYDEDLARQVILHEIAHARVGYGHGHDRVWKAEAEQLGASPTATLHEAPKFPRRGSAPAPWARCTPLPPSLPPAVMCPLFTHV
ncbi:SprT-like domain-containing protein [Actinobaculum sp. 313]|uniref:SprT-like domain-containing protein n=1 Tax=Actinobaculum sp. 313 TaxID=2495645 RepID=UPI000D529A0F|nr:SprT-like domain-containing protein [Actinobaculum sp. 313]AWE41489.1 sprT domain-containing protein [Actinobaculum sp. 313]